MWEKKKKNSSSSLQTGRGICPPTLRDQKPLSHGKIDRTNDMTGNQTLISLDFFSEILLLEK